MYLEIRSADERLLRRGLDGLSEEDTNMTEIPYYKVLNDPYM